MKFHLRRGLIIFVSSIIILGLSMFSTNNKSLAKDTAQDLALPAITYEHREKQAPMKFNGQVRKVAYLTFDDGPTRYTNQLIDVLNKYKVPATFFLIGRNIDSYPKYVKKLHDRGDYIGMHSMTHDYNTLYKKGKIVSEMQLVQRKIKALTNETPKLFRAPYGTSPGLTKNLRNQVVRSGMKAWDWTVDSNDWRYQNKPQQISVEIKKQLKRPVEIILLHDKQGTIKALPQIIKTIQSAGYEFEVYDESKHFVSNFFNDKRL